MNRGLPYIIAGGLILMGGVNVMAQGSGWATQVVSFAVNRTDAFSLQDRIVQKEMMSEISAMKVTVSFDYSAGESLRDHSSPTRNNHIDIAAVRLRELDGAFKSKSLLLTITD